MDSVSSVTVYSISTVYPVWVSVCTHLLKSIAEVLAILQELHRERHAGRLHARCNLHSAVMGKIHCCIAVEYGYYSVGQWRVAAAVPP
jgi:hypothetical protein